MSDRMKCPECRRAMSAVLTRRDDLPQPEGHTPYTLSYYCQFDTEHGTLVLCENGCGERVPHGRFHHSSIEGLLGSGRWSCIRRPDPAMYAAFSLNPPQASPNVTVALPLYLDPEKPHDFFASADRQSCSICNQPTEDVRHSRDSIGLELVRLQELERKVIGDLFHVVIFKADQWFIVHTLECRMAGMVECPIHAQVASDAADFRDNAAYGRYRIDAKDGALTYTKLADD